MTFYDIFKDLETLRNELDRVFNPNDWRRPFSRTAFLPAMGARQYPMINLSDDKENVYIEALAPGLNTEKLDLSVLNSTVTISGEKDPGCDKVDADEYHRCERAAGKFVRTIELSTPVDENKVKAEYVNGLLLITLPKAESAKPKRIAISAS